MIRTLVPAVVVFWALTWAAQAEDAPKVLAAGDWSKPVADGRGYAIRGRLVICEKPNRDKLRETPVYIELQDASDFVGSRQRLFCDLGKRDFRPEHKGGLNCEMRDKDGKVIEPTSYPFGGAVPISEWVSLSTDATIRLRATPFGVRREKALSISPHLGQLWVINDDDPKEYHLSGTFTVDPTDEPKDLGNDHLWRGTIELPAVRVVNAPGN